MIKSIKEKPARKIEIDLTGPEGNSWALISTARRLANELNERRGATYFYPDDIQQDMMIGDYEHMLEVMEKYFGDMIIMYR